MKRLIYILYFNIYLSSVSFSQQQTTRLTNHYDFKLSKDIIFYKTKVINGGIYTLIVEERLGDIYSKIYLFQKKENKNILIFKLKLKDLERITDFIYNNDSLYVLSYEGFHVVDYKSKEIKLIKKYIFNCQNVIFINSNFIFYNIYDFLSSDSINNCIFLSFNINDTLKLNCLRFNLPGIELSRLVESWVDFNDSNIFLCSPLSDTIIIINSNISDYKKISLHSKINFTNAQTINNLRKNYGYYTKNFIKNVLVNDTITRIEKIFIDSDKLILSVIKPKYSKNLRMIYLFKKDSFGDFSPSKSILHKCVFDSSIKFINYINFPINLTYSESQFFYNDKFYHLTYANIPPKKYVEYNKFLSKNKNNVSLKLLEYDFYY